MKLRRICRWPIRAAGWAIRLAAVAAVLLGSAWVLFPFPDEKLEQWPASPTVTDRDGGVMLQLVGDDDQWRFPVPLDEVSPWLVQATIAVEDERFRVHPGVDPVAVVRAAGQNASEGRTVSGASTLTMQVCRMIDPRPRTWSAKAVESFRALQLDAARSKNEVLEIYLNVAPYGRNVRGAEAAGLFWFAKHARDLSLGEAALLAGMPQSPSRYRPDLHPQRAADRRATVLRRMLEVGMISQQQHDIAAAEPVVVADRGRSIRAPHAAFMALSRRPSGGRTTIDPTIQRDLERVTRRHAATLPSDARVAAVVIDISTGQLLAVVGSMGRDGEGQVNAATAWRSPGSALKPFIYAAAFESRRLAPDSIVHDVPIHRAGWSPGNFDEKFRGPVPTGEALRQSLNTTAILVAEGVGLARCVGQVESAGVRLPADAASRGGLAVVTGAIEVRLIDLANGYATIGRGGERRPVTLFADEPSDPMRVMSRDVCAALDDVLGTHRRRPVGAESLAPHEVPWFMWKTGTSSGRRDALAVGHNGKFAVGVWVGRLGGAGDSEFVGTVSAEPLLAELFALPHLRIDTPPPLPTAWQVAWPLPAPAELDARPRITYPHNGAAFRAIDGRAVVRPQANHRGLTWLLDGRPVAGDPERLALAPGVYELRVVTPDGQADAVRITVR